MTIAERLTDYLTNRGLWADEAKAVLESAEAQSPEMEGRWGEDVGGYPDALLAVLLVTVRQCALEWIDANKPKHFARPLFAS